MRPEYRNNRDDAPRPVAAMAKTFPDGDQIPLHLHKRGQLIHAVSGTMKVETADAAWIVPPALALWMPPAYPHGMAMRGELAMRTIYIDPDSCRDAAADADAGRSRRSDARTDPRRARRAARL